MNLTIFISLLFGLQLFYWFIGKRFSKNITGQEDYFLAGKKVRLLPLMMTFLAVQVGGGAVLGAAEEAYRFGWPVLFYPLGMALGLILLGFGVGRKLAEFKVTTVAEIFEVAFQSRTLRKIASLLSILSLFMILVAQIIASSKFLVSLGFNNSFVFILFWAVVILYTAKGGLKAVIATDMAQALVFSFVFFLAFGVVFFANPSTLSIQIPHLESFSSVSPKLSGWLLMPLLFMVIEQDMGQRCFAGASPRIVSRATLLAGIGTMIVCIIPVFFGSLAKAMNLTIPQGGSVLMTVVALLTNPWISALVGCAVLAAIVSTATSLINAISSNLANDFPISFLQKRNPLRFIQGMTGIISILAIFFAFYFDNIVDLLIQSYDLSVSALFAPLAIAIFKKRGNAISAWSAILLGTMGFCLFRILPISFPKEIASLILSFSGYGIGEVIARYRVIKMAA